VFCLWYVWINEIFILLKSTLYDVDFSDVQWNPWSELGLESKTL